MNRSVGLGRTLVAGVLIVAAALVAGTQAQSPAGQFKTPWGEPDLQGIWTGETLTPLQRPARFANKPQLTPEEATQVAEQVLKRPGRENRQPGTEKDVAGAYNQIFVQRGTQLSDGRTSLITDPSDGRLPPMTPEGKARTGAMKEYLDALLQGSSGGRPGPASPRHAQPPPMYNVDRMNRIDGPEDRSLLERCMAVNVPMIDGLYRIVQSPGQVAIALDWGQGWGFNRIIPVDGSKHLPSQFRFWNGDARGRWEGDTLVVDITNFSPKREFQGSRENLHVVERYRRAGDGRLEYSVTVEDPTTWTRPWTYVVPWARQADKPNQFYESNCHEGNYGMVGMLKNHRAAEVLFRQRKGMDPRLMDTATGGDVGGGIEREGEK